MKLKNVVRVICFAAALSFCAGSVWAQDDNGGGPGGPPGGGPGGPGGPGGFGGFGGGGPGGGGPGGGGPGGGGFDPAQFQQMMMNQNRESLGITNDDEWSVIQPLIQKVQDARREAGNPGGRGPGGGFGGGRGGQGGRGGFGPQASDEEQALRKALEDNVPVAQVKDLLAKYRASRKDKQAKLETAQANLKRVLTTKQEALAVLLGLLP